MMDARPIVMQPRNETGLPMRFFKTPCRLTKKTGSNRIPQE